MKSIISAVRRADWQHGAHCLLHMTGFAVSTLLISWGLFVLFFLVLGGFSLDGLMHHLNNLTARYIVATPDRLASFWAGLAWLHLVVSAAIIVLRRHHILPSKAVPGSPSHV